MKEAIALLVEYKASCWNGDGQAQSEGRKRINQAIAILQQPKAQPTEFVKECREYINGSPCMSETTCKGYAERLKEACKIIDTSKASRKELLENLKMLVALLCHPGSFVSAKDIEKAKAAISNAGG